VLSVLPALEIPVSPSNKKEYEVKLLVATAYALIHDSRDAILGKIFNVIGKFLRGHCRRLRGEMSRVKSR
jgi:hypothetical protein